MTTNKFFPIKTATACKLKWTWTTLFLFSNNTGSCHRTGFSKINKENFFDFHNTELKINDRQRMLEGKWPESSCVYCKEIEASGGYSDRMLQLQQPEYVPKELDIDPTAVKVTPRILEVYLNNKCNLGCLYCFDILSSTIQQENKKFGYFEKNDVVIKPLDTSELQDLIPEFFSWLEINYQDLQRIQIEGGEPFLNREFDRLLDFFDTHPNSELELGLVTNLMLKEKILERYIARFKKLLIQKKLKRLDITCSIDCWGPQQEYVRYGLDLGVWERNFKQLLSNNWIKLNINQAITPLGIKTMPELIVKLNEWKQVRQVGHFFSTAYPGPTYMMLKIFGSGEFDNDYEKILQLMKQDSDEETKAYHYMKGIFDSCKAEPINYKEISKLITYLDEKDRRRETNWRPLFPWLEKYVVQ